MTDEGTLNLAFQGEARQVLLHGHCHQKSLVGTGPSRAVSTIGEGSVFLDALIDSAAGFAPAAGSAP